MMRSDRAIVNLVGVGRWAGRPLAYRLRVTISLLAQHLPPLNLLTHALRTAAFAAHRVRAFACH